MSVNQVGNYYAHTVTVIDGATHTVAATVSTGANPRAVAVNPVTNQVYVANVGSDNVTVINGATHTVVATVGVGTSPQSMAVNPVTNKVYVAAPIGNVTVIDGATHTVAATVTTGINPRAVAINPVTNQVYIANAGSDNVMVIDGATNTVVTTISAGALPSSVAVNPVTNRVYVANYSSANVTVIDGASNTVITTVSAGTNPRVVVVNPTTNQIYIANQMSANITVIDGSSNTAAATVGAGTAPYDVAVNPVTDKVYVANQSSNNVTVITPAPVWNVPLLVSITPLADNTSVTSTPTFTFNKVDQSGYLPITPPLQQIYFQVDTLTGEWQTATRTNGIWQGTTAALQNGIHILYAYATDGQDAGSVNPSPNYSPITGRISAYVFLVRAPNATYADPAGACSGNVPCYTSLQAAIAHTLPGGTVTAYGGNYAESMSLAQSITVTCQGDTILNGLSIAAGAFIAPGGTLTLNGDLIHTGGAFNANGGTVAFTGTPTRTITATVATQFNHLTVDTGVTLTLSTNNDNVGIGGTLTNNGALRKSFGITGVSLDFAGTLGSLTELTVTRVDQDHAKSTEPLKTGKYWTFTPNTGATNFNAKLTLPAAFPPTDQDKVCRYTGVAQVWDCAVTTFDTARQTITRAGVTAFSDWAVGADSGPTAVTLTGFAARRALLGSALWLMVLLLLSLFFWAIRKKVIMA